MCKTFIVSSISISRVLFNALFSSTSLFPGIPCYDPANLETVEITPRCPIKVGVSKQFLESNLKKSEQECILDVPLEEEGSQTEIVASLDLSQLQTEDRQFQLPRAREDILVNGFVIMEDSLRIKVIHPDEASSVLGLTRHHMSFSCLCPIYPAHNDGKNDLPVRCPSPVDLNAAEDGRQETLVGIKVTNPFPLGLFT